MVGFGICLEAVFFFFTTVMHGSDMHIQCATGKDACLSVQSANGADTLVFEHIGKLPADYIRVRNAFILHQQHHSVSKTKICSPAHQHPCLYWLCLLQVSCICLAFILVHVGLAQTIQS